MNKDKPKENDSTAFSDNSLPVIFHNNLKKDSLKQPSEHTLFKEDTASSHTDKLQQLPTAKGAQQSLQPDPVDRFYQDEMAQLRRYIQRAERINQRQMANLNQAKQHKPFLGRRLNPQPKPQPQPVPPQHSKLLLDTSLPQPTNIQKIRQIYVSKNVRKNLHTIDVNPRKEKGDSVFLRSLKNITEDSHEEEALRKNSRKMAGRNSLYAKQSTKVLLGEQPRSNKYIDRINSNGVKSSIDRIKGLPPQRKVVDTYYKSEQKVDVREHNDRYAQVEEDISLINNSGFKILPKPEQTTVKKDQATSMKTDSLDLPPSKPSIRITQQGQDKSKMNTERLDSVFPIDAKKEQKDQAENFAQVPSVHQLVIGKQITTQLMRQHKINESFTEDRVEWLIEEYKPHSEPFKNIDISGFTVKKYKNGVYFGQIKEVEGKPIKDGHGSIFYYNGRLYQGQFVNDLKHGRGLELYPDNSRYQGYFDNGQKSGKGRFTWGNGQIYDGQWSKGKKHGSGMWKSAGEQPYESYIGEWFEGRVQGFGVHTTAKGDRYEGEFKNSLKQGQGTERFQSGDVYVGTYFKGRQNGYGEYYYSNGDCYKGEFSNGLRHGKGFFKQGKTGDVFEGEFRNDKKCGHGEYVWASGDVYIGNFENDLRHGYGQMTTAKGKVYSGYWVNGKMFGDHAALTQTQRINDRQEDIERKSKTMSLQPIMKPQRKTTNKLSKSKSKSPSGMKSLKKIPKGGSPVKELEKSPDSQYRRACGCSRHHR